MSAAPGLPVAGGRQVLGAVGRLSRGRRARLAAAVGLLLVSAAAGLVLPLTIGWMVDEVTARREDGIPTALWWQVAALAAAAAVGGLTELVGTALLGRTTDTVVADLREELVGVALRLPPAELERVGVGDVVTRAVTDTRTVSEELPSVLPTVASAVSTLVLVGVGVAVIDWRFLVAFALAVPLYLRALRWYLPAVPPVYAALRSSDSVRGERVLSTLGALPTVTAYDAGVRRGTGVAAATWEVSRWSVRARIMQNRFFGRINLAEAVGLLLVIGCGFTSAAVAGVSLGQVTAAALLFLQLAGPLEALMFVMDDLQSAAASLARVVGVVDLDPGEAEQPDDADDTRAPGPAVRLDRVDFAYRPGHPVLHDVDLSVRPGEHLALVGSTGSGKTTLARLVAGTRGPTGGRVLRGVARDQVAYLDQDAHVFAATLRDNLLLAASGADDTRLREALDGVGATGLLHGLPHGLDTLLGPEGHRLTGGQAQLVSLARLLLRDPAVVVLDEATSEAGSSDAAVLDRAAETVLAGRSAIVIAHRLSQARACDRIVVLEHGRVVEEGSHEVLVARGGRYAELWRVHRGQG